MRRQGGSVWRQLALFNKPDEGEPEGGGGAGSRETRDAGLVALKAKYNNDVERALTTVYEDNWSLREKNRKLGEKVEAAKLPEGAVVITKEQAAEYAEYAKLGKVADLVKKEVLDAANKRIEEIDTEKLHARAAGLLVWKPTVTHDLMRDKGLHVEIKSETENGKAVERVYVRPKADDKAPLVLLQQHVEKNLADYLPALKEKQGVTLPAQQPAGGGANNGSTTLVDAHLAKRDAANKARVNPLTATNATK